MPDLAMKTLFDPSYTTDGVSPMHPWGRTRHALNPAIPAMIDGVAAEDLDPARVRLDIHEVAAAYGKLLHQREVTRTGVTLACAALRHAFDDTARWVIRRRGMDAGLATAFTLSMARLAEEVIEVVDRAYDERHRGTTAIGADSTLPNFLDFLVFAATMDHAPQPLRRAS